MDPIRLQLENFVTHSNSDISFDFQSAIIVARIKGNEKFSNGAGKSTIFSAIKYVLFNKVDFSTLDKAIRHGTDYLKVMFDFKSSSDNEVYRIIRSISKKTGSEVRFFRQSNDDWVDITQRRNSDTEKEIEKVIKINYKTFCNSVLFGQADLTGLASVTPEKRKLALKEALLLNVYSKYEAAAKKKTTDLVKDIDKEKIVLKTIGYSEDDLRKLEQELVDMVNLLSEKTSALKDLKTSFERENEKHLIISKEFENLERQAAESALKQKTLQSEIRKVTESIQDYNRKLTIVKEAGKGLTAELKEMTGNLNELQLKFDNFRDKNIIKNEIDSLTKELINSKASLNASLLKLEELRVPLPTGTSCKLCRQKIVDRESCQKEIDLEISLKEKEIAVLKTNLSDLESKSKSLNDEINHYNYIESKISTLKSSILLKNKEIESKRSLYSEYSEQLDNNTIVLDDKNKLMDSFRKTQFIEKSDEYISLKQKMSLSKSVIDSLKEKLDILNRNIVSLLNTKAILEHKIEEKKKDGQKNAAGLKNIEELEGKYLIHQKVVQAFGSAGIPALITHTILDDFQSETNIWLSRLRPGLQLQFSVIKDRSDGDQEDTLDIMYVLNGFDIEHAQLSGAQKFIVALALKLGLASVLKKRIGVKIGLFLIDEVDQCIDEGGLEFFEEAVKQLQQDFKVLVITHNNELKSKFNNAILVEQDEKFVSTAKVVNTW